MAFSVSVVVPTRNRHRELNALISSIAKAGRPHPEEIIVVDDASRIPVRVQPEHPNGTDLHVLRNATRLGPWESRNRGAEVAKGDVLAFLDDDAVVFPDWFSVLQRELSPYDSALTGPVHALDHSIVARARERRYRDRYRGLGNGDAVAFLAGGNSAVRRSSFVSVGGFSFQKSMADNALAARLMRLGSPCRFATDLAIWHRHSKGLSVAVGNAVRAGMASRQLNGAGANGTPPSRVEVPTDPRDYAAEALNALLAACFSVGSRIEALRSRGGS